MSLAAPIIVVWRTIFFLSFCFGHIFSFLCWVLVTLQGWRRPKTRTVMPRAANHKANGGGATSNGSTPSTPIGQGHQVSANQTPSTPPDMAASNKNKNKKVIGGCLLSLKHLCNTRKCTLHALCSKVVDV